MHLNFSGIPARSVLGSAARETLRLLPRDLCVRVIQGPLRGARWVVGSSNHGCWLGSYEFEKQRLFVDLVAPGDVVWDVGANVGFYTLLASRLTGSSGRVIAFEPLPDNVRYLRQHITLNGAANVEVLDVAIGERSGIAHFRPGQDRSTGSLDTGTEGIPVDVATLDALHSSGRIPRPHLIKMDIEGGETGALRGASEVLTRWKPTVLVATHGPECHRESVRQLLTLGYSVEGIGGLPADQTDELLARWR